MALVPLSEAQAHVLGACRRVEPEPRPLADALGLVLAEEVTSSEAVPPFDNSAMDGFAVQAADTVGASEQTPATLRIVATVAAGAAPLVAVGSGEAARIMTGAPLPAGADAIVIVERTSPGSVPGTVTVGEEVAPGLRVRRAGDDLRVGDRVFAPGEVLSPGHLGVLATIGHRPVTVHPPPRVAVFSTGDELVDDDRPLAPGQIRESNRTALLALLRGAGCEGQDLGTVADDEAAIAATITAAVEQADVVLTSGGVSMGDYDLVKVVLDRLGDMRWMQVAIRPAKPFAFGTVVAADGHEVPVFGLPGNPVSSMVSFELFARPALRHMMGHEPSDLHRPRVQAVTDEALGRRPDGKTHFARVICDYQQTDGRYHVRSAGGQGSHQLTGMAHANALAELPDGHGVGIGGPVEVLLLGG